MCRTLFSQLYSSVVLRWTPCFPFPYLSPFQYFLLPLLVSNIFSSQALLPLSLSDSALGKVRTIYSHSGMNDQQDKVLAGMGKGRLYLWFSGIRKNGSLHLHPFGMLLSHILSQVPAPKFLPKETSPGRARYFFHWACGSTLPFPCYLCVVRMICLPINSWTCWQQTPCFMHLFQALAWCQAHCNQRTKEPGWIIRAGYFDHSRLWSSQG